MDWELINRQQGPLRGSWFSLSRRGLNQLSQYMIHVSRMADPIAASAFNRLGQYASSPGHRDGFLLRRTRWPGRMVVKPACVYVCVCVHNALSNKDTTPQSSRPRCPHRSYCHWCWHHQHHYQHHHHPRCHHRQLHCCCVFGPPPPPLDHHHHCHLEPSAPLSSVEG